MAVSENDQLSKIKLNIDKLCFHFLDAVDFCFVLLMAALHSRCGRYIFALWFLLFFFPHLMSAVAEWMCTILLQSTHGVALVQI